MTVRKDARRQIKLKSLKVPLFQYPESAVEYHQRPGASISEFKPSVQWEAQPGMLAQLPPLCCHAALILPCAGILITASMVLFCTGAPKDLMAGLSLTLGIAVSAILSVTWQRMPSATATWRPAAWTHALTSKHAVIPPVLPVFRPRSSSPMSTYALAHTSGNAAVLQQNLSALLPTVHSRPPIHANPDLPPDSPAAISPAASVSGIYPCGGNMSAAMQFGQMLLTIIGASLPLAILAVALLMRHGDDVGTAALRSAAWPVGKHSLRTNDPLFLHRKPADFTSSDFLKLNQVIFGNTLNESSCVETLNLLYPSTQPLSFLTTVRPTGLQTRTSA